VTCGGPVEPEQLKAAARDRAIYRRMERRYAKEGLGPVPADFVPAVPQCLKCASAPRVHEELRPLWNLLAALPGVCPGDTHYGVLGQPIISFAADSMDALTRAAALATEMHDAGLRGWCVCAWAEPGDARPRFALEAPDPHVWPSYMPPPGSVYRPLDEARLREWAEDRLWDMAGNS
jgi:hypothetical protein